METIESIISTDEEFFYAYLKYLETIRCQDNIGMKEILNKILKNFYDLTGLSDEEKRVYHDPKNFKTLLTSPWIRIVKNQGLEEVGPYEFKQGHRKFPTDSTFAQIMDSEVREVIQ